MAAIKVYLDTNGALIIDYGSYSHKISKNVGVKMTYYNSNQSVMIRSSDQDFITNVLITELAKENGTVYTNKADLEAGIGIFF